MAAEGDIASNLALAAGQSVRRNVDNDAFEAVRQDIKTFTIFISDTLDKRYFWFHNYQNLTILRVDASIYGSTPSATFNIEVSDNIADTGDDVFTTDVTVTTVLSSSSGFSNDLIEAGHFVHITVSAVSGTITYLSISIVCQVY